MSRYDQEPVLRKSPSGDIYCSPWCGGNCLKAEYDLAVREAEEVAKELGPGWTPIVFENLGWHWRVERANVYVCSASVGGYRCYFNAPHQTVEHADTPRLAFSQAKAKAKKSLKAFLAFMEEQPDV